MEEKMENLSGPRHPDRCNHPQDSYVGTFCCEVVHSRGVQQQIFDFYIFENPPGGDQHVCLRYGVNGEDYESPGRLIDFLKTANFVNEHRLAIAMLNDKGKISWRKNA